MKRLHFLLSTLCVLLLPTVLLAADEAPAAESGAATTPFALTQADIVSVNLHLNARPGLQPLTKLTAGLSEAKQAELAPLAGKRLAIMLDGKTIGDIDFRQKADKRYLLITYPTPDEAFAVAKALMPDPKLSPKPFVASAPADVLVFALTAEDVPSVVLCMSRINGLFIEFPYSTEKLTELSRLSAESLASNKKVQVTLLGKAVSEIGPFKKAMADHVEQNANRPSLKVAYTSLDEAYATARDLVNRLQ